MIGYGWPLDGEAKKVHDIERYRASMVCSFVNINSDNSTRWRAIPRSKVADTLVRCIRQWRQLKLSSRSSSYTSRPWALSAPCVFCILNTQSPPECPSASVGRHPIFAYLPRQPPSSPRYSTMNTAEPPTTSVLSSTNQTPDSPSLDPEKQAVDPSATKVSAFRSLGLLDQFLALWIFLAMAIGIILGNFVPSTGPTLQKGKFVGVSVPIGMCCPSCSRGAKWT